MSNDRFRSEHDHMLAEESTIEEFPSCNMRLTLAQTKSSFLVSGREFVMLEHTSVDLRTGRIETVAGSVEDLRVPKNSSGLVRADLKASFVQDNTIYIDYRNTTRAAEGGRDHDHVHRAN